MLLILILIALVFSVVSYILYWIIKLFSRSDENLQ